MSQQLPPHAIQLEDLLQNSADPLYLVNARLRIVFFNRACETLTGVAADRLLGVECRWHGPMESFDLAGLAGSLCPPPEALAGNTATIQSLLLHADGQRSWHSIHFLPILGQDGSLAALLGRIENAAPEPPKPGESARQAYARLRQQLWADFGFDHVVAVSPAMVRVLAQVRLASQNSACVLLRGEAGTGKDTLARTIHFQSPERERPFVALDCRGLPTAVLERHLSEQGFLGAAQQGVGVLYLREPAGLPRDLQMRLNEQMRGPPLKGQPRIMAGSAADLQQACREGVFLESLFCRISTLTIDVPPLRERGLDLPLLVQQWLERCNSEGDKQVRGIHTAAMTVLHSYNWPGNLSELDAVLRQAHARAKTTDIHPEDLPGKLRSAVELAAMPAPLPERKLPLDELLANAERRLLELAVRRSKGNLSRAAANLGISRPRLHRRMQQLGLAEKSKDGELENATDDDLITDNEE